MERERDLRTRTAAPSTTSHYTRLTWIPTHDRKRLPPYEEKVLVVRPNDMAKKNEVLLGRLCKGKEEGVYYGKPGIGPQRVTYDDFWVVQGVGVLRFDRIICWANRPEVPEYMGKM